MESYLPSTQSKPANNKCRTCTKAKVSRYFLYQRISLDTELSKTYGELLICLLRNNASDKEETFMPQRLCIKCANLLKNIYVFLLETEKLHEIYLNRARSIKIVIKNEDCLQELLPIDLPQAPKTSSNGLEEQTTGDPYKRKKIYIKFTDQDTNKDIKDNRPSFQQHVA
uniref:ZAD domain-containing protein n=1 Tax=Glossina morsitans morsitans TaxID=37546 RepID=A0A1B0GA24_GLOMM